MVRELILLKKQIFQVFFKVLYIYNISLLTKYAIIINNNIKQNQK